MLGHAHIHTDIHNTLFFKKHKASDKALSLSRVCSCDENRMRALRELDLRFGTMPQPPRTTGIFSPLCGHSSASAVIYLHLNSRTRVGRAAHLVKVRALQVLGSVLDLLYGAGPGHAISWSRCWEMETSQPSFHFTVLRACGESEDGGESTQQYTAETRK